MYGGGFHGNVPPPGGILPGTATGVNPYPNNKPGLQSYLNNTPTTTSNFAPPPSFAPQATHTYIPHSGAGQQWNAGAQQQNVQSQYGQAGAPAPAPALSGYPPNVSPSGFGAAGRPAPSGYPQPSTGFNSQGATGAPSSYNSGGYGGQASQQPQQQQQPAQTGGFGYSGSSGSGGSGGGFANYAGTVTGPQYTQPQQETFNSNRPGYIQYQSPPPANVRPPPSTYGQPANQTAPQQGYGGQFNASGFGGNTHGQGSPGPQVQQNAYGNSPQAFGSGYGQQQQQAQPQQPQQQQQAQPQHQGWPAGGFPAQNQPDHVQSISQQWAQNNQTAQSHGKRYSVASVSEPYHSYAAATPPPPAAPKPERPANSATFFAATAQGPGAMSPPSSHAQPQLAAGRPAKAAVSSGFAGGGIGDWEHYGDFDGDDDDLDAASKAGKKQPTANEVPTETQAVEMPAVTPPQAQQPFPPSQQQTGGIHDTPQSQGMGMNQAHQVSPPQAPGFQNQHQTGQWGAGPQAGSQAGMQFQNLSQQGVPPPQPNQFDAGYNAVQAPYQQQQPIASPPQPSVQNPYNEGLANAQTGQSYQLTEQLLRKQQEEQLLRQQQEQQQHMQAQLQAQMQQQHQVQQQQAYPPQNQTPVQPINAYGQPHSPEAQMHQQIPPPQSGVYPPSNQPQPSVYGQNPQLPPKPAGFTPPQQAHIDPYGQQQYGHQKQPSLGAAAQLPVSDPYGQVIPPQQQPQQSAFVDPTVQPAPYSAEGAQVPPDSQYGGQYGQYAPGHQQRPSLSGPIPVQTPQTGQPTQDQEPVQPLHVNQAPVSHAPPVQDVDPAPEPVHETVVKSAGPVDDNKEVIEIPADLAPYYKESLRKFFKMIIREASAKSNVDALRIFTEFMEDETYSRGDRYSDVALHSFAGRHRPYTSESPDPYDVSRRTSTVAENPALRPGSTFDSIDSPLTNAIEALRTGGRKGGQSPSSVEHRLPYTIDEKNESVAPLQPQHSQHPQHLPAQHMSPPVNQTGPVQTGVNPYVPSEEPAQPIVQHHDTWGSQVEPAPLSVQPHQQPQEPVAPVQPLNVKRQSLLPTATPPNANINRPQSESPGLDPSQVNEASLAQQAAILAKQWIDSRGPGGTNSNRNSVSIDPLRQSHRQSIIAEPPRQSPAQNQDPYQAPHRQSIIGEPFRQSPAQHQNPYQQPHPQQVVAEPFRQSPAQKQNPYQQPPLQHGRDQYSAKSPPQKSPPYQHPVYHSVEPSHVAPLNSKSPPQQGQPFQQPFGGGFQSNFEQNLPIQAQGPQVSGFQGYGGPASPPRNEPVRPVEPVSYEQPYNQHAHRPSVDGTESSLDQGYVMVTPEPQRTPVNQAIQEPAPPANIPAPIQEQPIVQQKPRVDIEALTTILGRERDGLPDKLHLILPIRQAIENVGSDFTEINQMRKTFEVEAKKIRDKNEAERDRLKSEHDEYTEELYSQQKILYEDLHDIDEQFNLEQNAVKEKQEKEEFDKFNKEVFTPIYNMIQERIVELKKNHKALLAIIKTAASGREKYDANNNKPNLQDALILLLDIFGLLEVHHIKLQETIADRDKRFKSTVLTPLYASNNYAKLRDAKKYFDEEEKKAIVKAATDGLERARGLKTAVDDSMIPGLDLEFGFFDEVDQVVSKIVGDLPEDPKEYGGDPKILHDELAYARTVLETLTQTQVSMMKLYHHVNIIVNNCEKGVGIAQAKQRGEKPEGFKKIEEDKDAYAKTLDDELKLRLDDVDGHFSSAKKKLEPILVKFKAVYEGA
ncbi:hypothetical protein ABW19_dt0200779 [Dactylella cylindrospora]|nr:hypothetical protein ABW19_dt0200779 [Dactylella cylindrospora]